MALRLPRNLNPFSRAAPRPLTAREAHDLAEGERRRWAEADFAIPCCVYAGAIEGEDPGIGPLNLEGRSRLWHFDYYAAGAERFLRVQVFDAATRSEETRIRAGGLGYPQMTLPYAAYGYREDRGREAAPVALPEVWVDSPVITKALRSALSSEAAERIDRVGGIKAFVLPAACLRPVESLIDGNAVPSNETAKRAAALIVEDPADGGKLRASFIDALSGGRIGI